MIFLFSNKKFKSIAYTSLHNILGSTLIAQSKKFCSVQKCQFLNCDKVWAIIYLDSFIILV